MPAGKKQNVSRNRAHATHHAIEGSVAFIDISGFTQLTEKLARRGKVGAEEVSDTLNTIFTQLLDVAYEYDAGLLAESMHRLATDRQAAAALGARGCMRYAQRFTNEQIERRFLGALEELCGLGRI